MVHDCFGGDYKTCVAWANAETSPSRMRFAMVGIVVPVCQRYSYAEDKVLVFIDDY